MGHTLSRLSRPRTRPGARGPCRRVLGRLGAGRGQSGGSKAGSTWSLGGRRGQESTIRTFSRELLPHLVSYQAAQSIPRQEMIVSKHKREMANSRELLTAQPRFGERRAAASKPRREGARSARRSRLRTDMEGRVPPAHTSSTQSRELSPHRLVTCVTDEPRSLQADLPRARRHRCPPQPRHQFPQS